MASAHIEINGTATRHNSQLRGFIDRLTDVIQDAQQLKYVFDQAAAGGDWDALGALLGIDAVTAEAVYNLMGSVNTEFTNAGAIQQLISRAG